jgi:hypothetical protein
VRLRLDIGVRAILPFRIRVRGLIAWPLLAALIVWCCGMGGGLWWRPSLHGFPRSILQYCQRIQRARSPGHRCSVLDGHSLLAKRILPSSKPIGVITHHKTYTKHFIASFDSSPACRIPMRALKSQHIWNLSGSHAREGHSEGIHFIVNYLTSGAAEISVIHGGCYFARWPSTIIFDWKSSEASVRFKINGPNSQLSRIRRVLIPSHNGQYASERHQENIPQFLWRIWVEPAQELFCLVLCALLIVCVLSASAFARDGHGGRALIAVLFAWLVLWIIL